MTYALAIHGGAGARPEIDYTRQREHMAALAASGRIMLADGGKALDVVTEMVMELEVSGLYVAGRGAFCGSDGHAELDASIMDGRECGAGAVAAIRDVRSPVRVARCVMERTPHVMLAGEGARAFAEKQGLDLIDDPAGYFQPPDRGVHAVAGSRHGTVGAVALDSHGDLAAATSTGGIFDKLAGRVGDSPVVGSGTWADRQVAVSCTGVGEYFLRCCSAHDVAARMNYGGAALAEASAAALDIVAELGGEGGLIAIDRAGNIAMPYNSRGMKRAAVSDSMEPAVFVFEEP